MIFVTVGSVFPFDRLIRQMDQWAHEHPEQEVFAQIGSGAYHPKNMASVRMLSPGDFEGRVGAASLIVAHAGMGTIITAMEHGKPLIVLPRRVSDREHTTEHQFHTANWLNHRPGVWVAFTDEELAEAIALGRAMTSQCEPGQIQRRAPEQFTARIRQFLSG